MVPFHDSIEGMLVPFIGPDRACYLVAGLFSKATPVVVSLPSEIVTFHRPATSVAPTFAAADANNSRVKSTRPVIIYHNHTVGSPHCRRGWFIQRHRVLVK